MEDEKLVRRLQKGSRTALEQVINRYTAYVSTIVWRTLGAAATREDTEEVVSDVFLSLWSHAHELDPKQGLRPWLGAVARNRATDCLRKTKPTVPLPEDDGPSPVEGPEETAAAKDQAERLWQAVDGLGEPDRTLFLRHYYYGEKLSEAVRDLGLSPGAARIRLSRGRKKLREILTKGGEGL